MVWWSCKMNCGTGTEVDTQSNETLLYTISELEAGTEVRRRSREKSYEAGVFLEVRRC